MEILDVVALMTNLPQENLCRGQVGTIVEVYEPGVFEVDFLDLEGKTYGLAMLHQEQLIKLYYHRVLTSSTHANVTSSS